MKTSVAKDNLLPAKCKVCESRTEFFEETQVLRKYRVRYFRCDKCGFMQTEEPYWLDEAYSSAIARQDVGAMQRNLVNCEITGAVLNLLFPKTNSAVDFGAGHGVFVRLMRDRGFKFFWSDRYATNDYARGFECQDGATFDFLTAFELLEHFVDPVSGLEQLMNLSDNVFVSTCLVPDPVPRLADWWYYVPTSGQHIAFYTKESLGLLATRFGRHLLSFGQFHLFTRKPQSSFLYRLANGLKTARTVNFIYRRPSLIESDLQQMTR
ncbi:MAG: class I SAM-dependent methyltransferase [Terracidiphilus sp.]